VAAIDDATGLVTAATFRDQEDAAGYLSVLRQTVRRHGVPVALYRDRHSIFETSDRGRLTLEEELVDRRLPTQVGRALEELGITSIAARSPQAKGRIERLWGTLQDRLVTELRLAEVSDRGAAERLLPAFLRHFNRSFTVPALDATGAWRPRPAAAELERICCLKYLRTVANDHTVRAGVTHPAAAAWPRPARLRRQARRSAPASRRSCGRLGWPALPARHRGTRRSGPAAGAGTCSGGDRHARSHGCSPGQARSSLAQVDTRLQAGSHPT